MRSVIDKDRLSLKTGPLSPSCDVNCLSSFGPKTRSPQRALKRSFRLTRGHRTELMVIFFLAMLVVEGLQILIKLIPDKIMSKAPFYLFISQLFVVVLLIPMFLGIFLTLLYRHARIEGETVQPGGQGGIRATSAGRDLPVGRFPLQTAGGQSRPSVRPGSHRAARRISEPSAIKVERGGYGWSQVP